MVTIVPADEAQRRKLSAADTDDDAVECFILLDGKRQAGYILCVREGNALRILELQTEQPVFADGLVRAAMNCALAQGMERAVCTDKGLKPMLLHIGFTAQGSDAQVMLRDFFSKPCTGQTKRSFGR